MDPTQREGPRSSRSPSPNTNTTSSETITRTTSAVSEEIAAEVWRLELQLLHALRDDALSQDERERETKYLLAQAHASPVPEMAVAALTYALLRDIDELTDDEPPGFGDGVEDRLDQLYRAGETTCGRCLRLVPDRLVLSWWRTRRLAMTWRPEEAA
jgi:hypothetical protein